jgi:transcriptional regulator with XRE-family HTH domain
MDSFTMNFKNQRKKKGISRKELAETLNMSISAIQQWENGNNRPTTKTLEKISDILETTPDQLLGYSQSEITTEKDRLNRASPETDKEIIADPLEQQLLVAFRLLNSGQQKYELGRIEALAGIDLEKT